MSSDRGSRGCPGSREAVIVVHDQTGDTVTGHNDDATDMFTQLSL